MLPALLVGFKRLENLQAILSLESMQSREILLFVDRSPTPDPSNENVIRFAKEWSEKTGNMSQISDFNLGVGSAVPKAVDWALNFVEEVAVLEDDCIPSRHFFDFCESLLEQIENDPNVILVCGSAGQNGKSKTTLSNFPLIWGWATNREKWKEMRELMEVEPSWATSIGKIFIRPSLLIPFTYFLAAKIRTNRGKLFAWDCQLAFGMIVKNRKSVVPNFNLVTNVGADIFAHHVSQAERAYSRTLSQGSDEFPNLELDKTHKSSRECNKATKKLIYNMRWKHLLSPIKALWKP
jgi:hypothetical protein